MPRRLGEHLETEMTPPDLGRRPAPTSGVWLSAGERAQGVDARRPRGNLLEAEENAAETCVCVEQAMEHTDALVVVLDEAGAIVRLNPAFTRVTGASLEEVRGEDWYERFVPARLRDRARQLFDPHPDNELGQGWLGVLVTRSAGERIVRWYATRLSAREDGGVLLFGLDVTDERVAHDALARDEDRLRRFAAHVDDGLWLLDARTDRLVYANPACELVLGCASVASMADRATLLAPLHPDDRAALESTLMAVRSGARSEEAFSRVVRADGSHRWIRTRVRAIKDERGAVTHVAAVTADVTTARDRERETREIVGSLEDHIALQRAELDGWQRRTRELVERLPGIVLVCAPDGSVVDASRRARALVAWLCGGASHAALGDLFEPVARRGASVVDTIARALGGETVRERATLRGSHREGAPVLELEYAPLSDRAGVASSVLVIASEPAPLAAVQDLRSAIAKRDEHIDSMRLRAKNQLQLVSSLLFLEARRVDDLRLSTAFEASRDRIRIIAMASEHDLEDRVELSSYLAAILAGLSLGPGRYGSGVAHQLEPCSVDHDVAVALGLIVHELVARGRTLPESHGGAVRVALRADAPRKWRLTIEHDAAVEWSGPRSLGVELAERLAAQLGSGLQRAPERSAGASFVVPFEA